MYAGLPARIRALFAKAGCGRGRPRTAQIGDTRETRPTRDGADDLRSDIDGFTDFVHTHGGSYRAYTATDRTTYHFELKADGFPRRSIEIRAVSSSPRASIPTVSSGRRNRCRESTNYGAGTTTGAAARCASNCSTRRIPSHGSNIGA